MTLLDARLTASDELDEIVSLAQPLTGPGDLDPLLDRIGDARRRYDAFCYFDATDALHPLHPERDPGGERQTYPWAT